MSEFKAQNWANGTGQLGGLAAYLRKNVSLVAAMQRTHPYALIVNLIYNDRGSDGLPCNEVELLRLDENEEAVADWFTSHHDAHFAMVVTSDGTRDLFLYLPRQLADGDVEAQIQAINLDVDFDFSLHHDPNWQPYHDLMRT